MWNPHVQNYSSVKNEIKAFRSKLIKTFIFLDSPILLSFPHFYLADDSLRLAVEGISPPEKEKHQLFIDVQPVSKNFTEFR